MSETKECQPACEGSTEAPPSLCSSRDNNIDDSSSLSSSSSEQEDTSRIDLTKHNGDKTLVMPPKNNQNEGEISDEENETLLSRMEKTFKYSVQRMNDDDSKEDERGVFCSEDQDQDEFINIVAEATTPQMYEDKIERLNLEISHQKTHNLSLMEEISELKAKVEEQEKEKGKNLALNYQLEKSRFDIVKLMNDYNTLVTSKVSLETDLKKKFYEKEAKRDDTERTLRNDIDTLQKEKKILMSHLKDSQRVIKKKDNMIQSLEKKLTSARNERSSSHSTPMTSSTANDLIDEIERLMEENIQKSSDIEALNAVIEGLERKLTQQEVRSKFIRAEMNEWPSMGK